MTPTTIGANGNQAYICLSCGERFVFTVREREFYDRQVLVYPKRCPDCRVERRKAWPARKPEGQADRV